MPGWVTQITYTKNAQTGFLVPSYDPLLATSWAVKIIHNPYEKSGQTAIVKSWDSVESEISAQGFSIVWERINEDNSGTIIPGAVWFAGDIPDWDIQENLPVIYDHVFRQVVFDLLKDLYVLGRQDGVRWLQRLFRFLPVYVANADLLAQKALNVAEIIARVALDEA